MVSTSNRDAHPQSHPLPESQPNSCTEDFEASDEEAGCASDDDNFMDVGENSDTEVTYVREGVAAVVAKNERIMGRLSLIKQNRVMFLAWLPCSPGSLLPDGTFHTPPIVATAPTARDRTMYAVHPIPLSEVKAVRKHAPSFGTQHIVVVLTNGLTLPPLYFTAGGVRALFSALKEHCDLVKSAEDPNTYLINDTADPLQQSLSGLLLDGLPPSASAAFAPRTVASKAEGSNVVSQMWEGVARVTARARESTQSFLESSVLCTPPTAGGDGPGSAAVCVAQPPLNGVEWLAAEDSRAAAAADDGERVSVGEAATAVGAFELLDRDMLESATSVRNAPRPPPMHHEEFCSFLGPDGRIANEKAMRARVFYSGCEPEVRREVWKFLLGLYPADSTALERAAILKEKKRRYATIKSQWTSIGPEQAAKWSKWRERRSRVEKDVRRTDRSQPFYRSERGRNVRMLRAILLSYCIYNYDLGYVQGMSDMVAPILYVMHDEAEAFWCFACLMEKLEANFHTDCRGMQSQLVALSNLMSILDPQLTSFLESKEATNYYFCYRWLLILFKREFSTYEEVLRLWEALWSRHVSPHFHIFMCAGVLGLHRRAIMDADLDFDGILRYCIQLSGKLDLHQVLRCAEKLALLAGPAGQDSLRAAGLT
ncbi:TBC1 domain family member 15 [Coccomyxa sp. Obi]|nr:TBC1 domain family member 15 [Coccomyxa sp. Obi]